MSLSLFFSLTDYQTTPLFGIIFSISKLQNFEINQQNEFLCSQVSMAMKLLLSCQLSSYHPATSPQIHRLKTLLITNQPCITRVGR